MKDFQTFKREALADPAVRREYDALAPQYELASKLIELRLRRKLSQAALAKKIGTKQSAIARLESGSYNPSMQMLRKIAHATGTRLTIELR